VKPLGFFHSQRLHSHKLDLGECSPFFLSVAAAASVD
jgi:hypothetical protein